MMKVLSEKLNICLNDRIETDLKKFSELFLEYNSHTNLISKNDAKFLFEKHIFDSLALNLVLDKYGIKGNIKVLDIGTGGGFPSLPLSICYRDMGIVAVDSTRKKIKFINMIKNELNLPNIIPVNLRVENLDISYKNHFDIVTSRAVAGLEVILEYGLPFVKKGGYFIAYKSKNVGLEIEKSEKTLKASGGKIIDKIEYKLPLEEDFIRYLVLIKF